jgi:type I restriction enzyme R subunit
MGRNVREAVKLYSGEGCPSLFVDKLEENLEHMNQTWKEIVHVFEAADVTDLERLPDSVEACAKFAKLFKDLHSYLEMAKVQGFTWGKSVYTFKHDSGEDAEVEMAFCENDYLTLAQRYKELARDVDVRADHDDIPFALDGYLTEIDTGHIDVNYMNANFTKWLKKLKGDETSQEELDCLLDDIHRSFGTLTQEQQRIAETIIHTAQRGDLNVRPSMSFMDYITESQAREKDDQIRGLVDALGVDEGLLRKLLGLHVTERDINEYGRLDNLERTIDQDKARAFFEARAGQKVPSWKVRMWPPELLRRFILKGGFDVRTYDCDDEETGEHE